MKKLLPLAALLCASIFAIAQQNVGIGTNDPKSKLDVKGGIAIGNGYSGVTAAPTDGAIIEGTVGIGTPSPDSKAALDVTSTTKGMLIPRMTTVQRNAITSPTTGLLIYNTTTNQFNYFNGTTWDVVGAGAGGPPTGTAGGDLTGSYPNPTVATGAVTSGKIADGTITGTDIANNTIDLTTKVNNVLPVGNGGTGVNTVTGIVQGNGGSPVTGITATAGSQYMRRNSANTAYEFGQVNYGDIAGTPTGLPPTGTANGDLSGTYPNPTVDGLQGRAVSATAPGNGQVLKYNTGTSQWEPAADNNGGGTVTSIATGTGLTGGPITGSGTVSIANTGVGAGKYNSVTVNAQGQVTAATVQPYLTGNQAVTLTGDVTGSGTTSIGTTIANNAVNSAKIQDGTVSSADMTATGVGAGTYTKVTVDAAGRVTGASPLAAGDIPDLSGTYIKNQTAQQAGANFNISGNGVVAGNVGIGATTPGAKLHIIDGTPASVQAANGSTKVLVDAASGAYTEYRNSADNNTYTGTLFTDNNLGGYVVFRNAPDDKLHIGGYGGITFEVSADNNVGGKAERARFDANGNLGIGTTAPKALLSVSSGGDMVNIYAPSDNRLAIQTTLDNQVIGTYGGDGENRLALQPTIGRVGIGTTEPAYKLHVAGNAFVSSGLFVQGNTGSIYGASPGINANADNHAGGGILISDDGGFFDYNDAYVTFNGSTGLKIAGASGASSSGNLMVNSLAGTGNRVVYADASGVLKAGTGNDNTVYTMSANMASSPDDITTGLLSADNNDDNIYNFNMGFSVTIDGVAYSNLTVCTNGWVAFGTVSTTTFAATALPTSLFTNPVIFPYWTDLKDFGSGEYIYANTVGTAPNRTACIYFRMRAYTSGSTNWVVHFQVQIHEGSGLINVKYFDPMQPTMNGQAHTIDGVSRNTTIGFQTSGGASAKAYPISYNGKVLDDNRDDTEGWSVCPVR